MVDITYSIEANKCKFAASTPAGETWIGKPEVTIPVEDARDYREAAQRAGLIVEPLPL